jgi:hypothetical protein
MCGKYCYSKYCEECSEKHNLCKVRTFYEAYEPWVTLLPGKHYTEFPLSCVDPDVTPEEIARLGFKPVKGIFIYKKWLKLEIRLVYLI